MAERQAMSARGEILSRLKAARPSETVEPVSYRPVLSGGVVERFIAQASVADAIVAEVSSLTGAPEQVAAIFSETERPGTVHIPKDSPLAELPWREAGLSVTHDGPPGDAVSVSMADFAIAETGTIVFRSGPTHPSSWHFLSGTECVLVPQDRIVPTLEDVIGQLGADGMPATLNLITGPSRTADIEQTIERGAHGPRALRLFVYGT
jgi:L-lactate dehydrogenase complex protein LldG